MLYLSEEIVTIAIEGMRHTVGALPSILICIDFRSRKEVITVRYFTSHGMVKSKRLDVALGCCMI